MVSQSPAGYSYPLPSYSLAKFWNTDPWTIEFRKTLNQCAASIGYSLATNIFRQSSPAVDASKLTMGIFEMGLEVVCNVPHMGNITSLPDEGAGICWQATSTH